MLNSKQRAALRGLANGYEPVLQVGKGKINEQMIAFAEEKLDLNELIKISVLENAGMTAREAASEFAEATKSDVVQVIGRRFILYRKSRKPECVRIIFDGKSGVTVREPKPKAAKKAAAKGKTGKSGKQSKFSAPKAAPKTARTPLRKTYAKKK